MFFSSYSIDSPSGGSEVRTRHILKNLVRMGEFVELNSPGTSNRSSLIDGIRANVIRSPLSSRVIGSRFIEHFVSLTQSRFGFLCLAALDPAFTVQARRSIREADVVVARDVFQVFPLLYARAVCKPFIVDLGGFVFPKVLSSRTRVHNPVHVLRMLIIAIMERIVLPSATSIIVSCREDKRDLHRTFGIDESKVSMIEDGVDEEEFRPNMEEGRMIRAQLGLSNEYIMVVFVGNLLAVHNFEAARHIVEHISALVSWELPVRFVIVGPHGTLPRHWYYNEQVRFTGYVPRVSPYVNAADICIAPLSSGSGMKTKVLGYLACLRPVITTPQGAEGLNLRHEHDAIVCDLESFPSWVQRLAASGSFRETLSSNLARASPNLSWKARAIAYHDLLMRITRPKENCS